VTHRWDLTEAEARALQRELAGKVERADRFGEVRTVGGVDLGFARSPHGAEIGRAALVVLRLPERELVERQVVERPVSFPYVPGLLSFREAPAVLAAFERVQTIPDVVLFDGQGYAHPRRFGLASHLGVVLDLPSIGCAKSRLVGQYEEPLRELGAFTPLVDGGETVGAAVRTRPRHAPLFVSPGHKIGVASAVAITLACCREGAFMPVPTRAAHDAVTAHARQRR
jgi:deoxyribonuclease V